MQISTLKTIHNQRAYKNTPHRYMKETNKKLNVDDSSYLIVYLIFYLYLLKLYLYIFVRMYKIQLILEIELLNIPT